MSINERLPVPRPFRPDDAEACMRLFQSNLPRYFAPEEEAEFAAFLRNLTPNDLYYVIAIETEIVACGGLALSKSGTIASFTWGMVDQTRHGEGLGKMLAAHRIAAARNIPAVTAVHLDTSQFTKGFYGHMGFTLVAVKPDGYGAGFDKCAMVFAL